MDGWLMFPGSIPAYMKYFVIIFLNFFKLFNLFSIILRSGEIGRYSVVGHLGSVQPVGDKTSFSFTHFDSVMDESVPAASRLTPLFQRILIILSILSLVNIT